MLWLHFPEMSLRECTRRSVRVAPPPAAWPPGGLEVTGAGLDDCVALDDVLLHHAGSGPAVELGIVLDAGVRRGRVESSAPESLGAERENAAQGTQSHTEARFIYYIAHDAYLLSTATSA